jgi:uncharacterized protein (TIGR01777 family)
MLLVFILLTFQAALGAFDNFWHHELQARLPQRLSARRELALHAARELIYGLVFFGLAWFEWHGAWAFAVALLLVAEIGITLADFTEEDRSRRLPPFERALHTVLAIGYGVFLATFAPILMDWGRQPTGLSHVDHGVVSWAFSVFSIVVIGWSFRNAAAVWRLGGEHPLPRRQALASPSNRQTVLVTGATGFIGSALVSRLVCDGSRVIAVSRDPLQARQAFGPGVSVVDRLDDIPGETRIDAVVHLAGAPALGRPWTAARRRVLLQSRIGTTADLLQLMQRLQSPPRVLVCASAVGYYGAVDASEYAHRLDEGAPARPGQFQSDLCVATEREAQRAEALGVRVVCPRFGIVLGRRGGAYPALALAARLGLGAVLGSGRQPMPWILLDDALELIRFSMHDDLLTGPVNAVAPGACTQAEFARACAASFGRKARLRMPAAPLRWMLGEMSDLLLEGQPVVPAVASAAGYCFMHSDVASACTSLAGGSEDQIRDSDAGRVIG